MLSAVCGAPPRLEEEPFEPELKNQVKFVRGEDHSRQREELVGRQRGGKRQGMF